MVQGKYITFPTDSGLYLEVLEKLVAVSKKLGIELRRPYEFWNKVALAIHLKTPFVVGIDSLQGNPFDSFLG